MEFAASILAPDANRPPAYDSALQKSRWFHFQCAGCSNQIRLDLPSYIGTYSDREHVLGSGYGELIRLHFGLPDNKSLAGGWPNSESSIVATARPLTSSTSLCTNPQTGGTELFHKASRSSPLNYSLKRTATNRHGVRSHLVAAAAA